MNWWSWPKPSGRLWAQPRRPEISSGPTAKSFQSGRYGACSSPGTQTLRLWQSSRRGLARLPGRAAAVVAGLVVTEGAGGRPGLAAGAPVQATSSNPAATISSEHGRDIDCSTS